MAKALTKSAIVAHLAKKAGMTKKAISDFLDDLATLAYKEAKNTFTLPGIGKLVLANRKAWTGRNPQTGKHQDSRQACRQVPRGQGVQGWGAREEVRTTPTRCLTIRVRRRCKRLPPHTGWTFNSFRFFCSTLRL